MLERAPTDDPTVSVVLDQQDSPAHHDTVAASAEVDVNGCSDASAGRSLGGLPGPGRIAARSTSSVVWIILHEKDRPRRCRALHTSIAMTATAAPSPPWDSVCFGHKK